MPVLEQDYEINASIEKVYDALTDPELMAQWSGEKAVSDAKENGEFSLWGGIFMGCTLN